MRKIILFLALSGLLALFAKAQQDEVQEAVKTPTEIVSLRTERSETFDNHDGTYTARTYSGRKYYKDGLNYKKIDLSVKTEIKDDFTRVVKAGTYTYRYDPANISKGHKFARRDYYVIYKPTGNWTGKISEVTPVTEGIKENITFASKSDSSVSWKVYTNTEVSFSDGELTFKDSTGAFLFMVPRTVAFDSVGLNIPVEASFYDDTLTYVLTIPKDATWPVILDPSTTVQASNDGYVNITNANYTTARDAASGGGYSSSNVDVGQKESGADYTIWRSFASFAIPTMSSCTAGTLYVHGKFDASDTDFEIYIHGAQSYLPTLGYSDYPVFDGRQTGGVHNGTVLNDTWNSSSYSADWNTIVFNSAGRDSVVAQQDGTLGICLISKEDFGNDAPGDGIKEYINFASSSDTGEEPYISITYTTLNAPTNFRVEALSSDSIMATYTIHHSSDVDSVRILESPEDTLIYKFSNVQDTTEVIGNLEPDKLYTWYVRVDSLDIYVDSNLDSLYTHANEPAAFDILQVSQHWFKTKWSVNGNPDS
ncbi:MAG TPA: hypothetical protein ENH82_17930, partial [bacterium]|nr:hypothetical protein [bacterium]